MNVHLVTECWGLKPSQVSTFVYTDHAAATVVWEWIINAYLAGSGRDADVEIKASRDSGVFHTGDGFISIVTEKVDENVIGLSVGNPNSLAKGAVQ